MADIFISYKKVDAGRVNRIVEGLRAEGFSVWWDHAIAPGAQWDETIHRELHGASLVIAVWSQNSIDAPWVKEEASVGKSRGRLLPVRIDPVDPPLGFGLIQTADLSEWNGDTKDSHWTHFLGAARAVLEGKSPELERPVNRRPGWTLWKTAGLVAAAFAVMAVAGVGWGVWTLSRVSTVSVDYGDGSSSSFTRTGPAATAATAAPTASAAETEAFEAAQASKLKADYLAYLDRFPAGAYAERIQRDVLTACRTETRGKPAARREEQAVSAPRQEALTQAQACASARAVVEASARRTCETLSAGSSSMGLEFRNDACDCGPMEAGFACGLETALICTWEGEDAVAVEVCG